MARDVTPSPRVRDALDTRWERASSRSSRVRAVFDAIITRLPAPARREFGRGGPQHTRALAIAMIVVEQADHLAQLIRWRRKARR